MIKKYAFFAYFFVVFVEISLKKMYNVINGMVEGDLK